jgi:hypothetical protein
MKRLDGIDICLYVIIIPLSTIAALMMIISFVGLFCQKESFINQNEYCVVIDKDSRLRPRVTGAFVSSERVNRIDALGLTTQDTVTIDIDRCGFDNIEIGDTVKTINLR